MAAYSTRPELAAAGAARDAGLDGFIYQGLPDRALRASVLRIGQGEHMARLSVDRITTWEAAESSSVGQDGCRLAARQAEALRPPAAGVDDAGIAARTCVSVGTVKQYLRSAYRSLGVASRAEAIGWWRSASRPACRCRPGLPA